MCVIPIAEIAPERAKRLPQTFRLQGGALWQLARLDEELVEVKNVSE